MNTNERLAQVLHARGLFKMEAAARIGRYNDFQSESATPCVDLVHDLQKAGAHDLAKRAMDGEFDASKEEGEEWYQREGKNLLKSILIVILLLLPIPAHATPILYDLFGNHTTDGGDILGSYIMEGSQILDYTAGVIYPGGSSPSFGWTSETWLTIAPGISFGLAVVPIGGQIRLDNVADGIMPTVYEGLDIYGTSPEDGMAVRLNAASCQGCSFYVGAPGTTWISPYAYMTQPAHAVVPEAPSILYMALGALWFLACVGLL